MTLAGTLVHEHQVTIKDETALVNFAIFGFGFIFQPVKAVTTSVRTGDKAHVPAFDFAVGGSKPSFDRLVLGC
ncbi:hypothetical protein KHS38_11985 [Mucilaginibacter sp. Bleaf8]|uniref:hypothetical protein n=1 Tax=Mucilaginibacter sp. Bleaf8 TaxID=2834430 RepID=UPI001BCE88CC|nr:hypothetical protein [Mucilaginibacter sp. Bleaf8]MBS7565125.1 hypothetical protein [Mucilaginibacter sp. Bleaf8]